MKNITLSIDDETHRQARIRAAEMGTSVSALVRGFLQSLGTQRSSVGMSSLQSAGEVRDGPDFGYRTSSVRPPDPEPAETPLQRRRRLLNEVWTDFDKRGIGLRSSENLSREELYEEAMKSEVDEIR